MPRERLARRVEQLLEDARVAHHDGDHAELDALAMAALTLDPDNREAQALLDGSARRCHMTLMFCDVVGSTALADGSDPEDVTDILRDYRATCTRVIEQFGGFIEDRRGDGLLVRFGYPWVHEDDARRAVLSGLELLRAVRDRGPVLGTELHVRVAAHTGVVVLDEGRVVGAPTNEAARLQAFAAPDTLVISDATHALVKGYFDVSPLGAVDLRGVSRPVEAFTVLRERASTRLEAAPSLTPFAGRRRELALIEQLWRAAREDGPRALLVIGEPGIGKSRLVAEGTRLADARRLVCSCSRYHQTTSLYPFRRALETACDVGRADEPPERLRKLRSSLGDRASDAELPLLAGALSIPASDITPPADVDPSKLRLQAIDAAGHLVRSYAMLTPAVLVVDDAHWADETTLELVSALLDAPLPGLLLVLTARPAFAPPWPGEQVAQLRLSPLRQLELEEMTRGMTERSRLSDERQQDLIARSDGVPLFLEELVRTAEALPRERDSHRWSHEPDDEVPPVLRDPLLSRLALPGIDLALAQTASVIGRDVDRELLREVSGLEPKSFEAKLANLIAAGLADPSGELEIRFRHELIRAVAYETQRRAVCRERHSRTADVLARDPNRRSSDAGELAFHLEKARRYDEAVGAHVAAARAGQALGAHTEATTELTHALGLVEHVPDGPARMLSELGARQLRSFSAIMTGGYSAPEPAEDHARCVELCESLGLTPELLPSLVLSWSYYCFRGDLSEADRVCDTMERVIGAGDLRSPASGMARGVTTFFRGGFDEARALMEAFVTDPWAGSEGGPPAGWPLPNDPLAAVSGHLMVTMWITGDQAAAVALGERALARSDELPFPFGPFSGAYVRSQFAVLRRLQGDHEDAQRFAGEMVEIGRRHGFLIWTLAGMLQHGLTRVHLGDVDALEPLKDAVASWSGLFSADVWSPYWLTELAVVEALAGRPGDARRSLDEGLAVAARTGSEFYVAETLRRRGVLRLNEGDAEGLADLEGSLTCARHQRAPAFESRTAASLPEAAIP